MLKKVLKTISVFILLILWIFSGWPVIWQNPRIPPEISKTLAATEDRQNYYAESTGVSTYNTNTNYQDKTTLSFTPDDNSTYLIIASWLMNENSESYAVQGKLTRTTGTAKDFNELIYQPKDATDYIAGGAIGFDTFGSSPGSQTYKIQYKTSSTSGTASIKEAKIIAIKLNSSDKYAEQETRTTSSSTSPVDKTTLTFTPDSAGDYIVIATATGDGQRASYDFDIQLDIDGTSYSSVNVEPAYTANRYLWGAVKRINLTAASHTIKIQYNAESSATDRNAGIAHARIVALRADLFNNNYYAESENRVTTTSTSYQDKTTLTQTPLAQDHLIIGSANVDGSSSSYESYVQLIKSTTSYGEMLMETKDATTQGYPYFAIKKETLANSSTTWKVQYMSENSSNTAGIKDARISVIELRQPYITVGTSGTQMSNIEAPSTNSYIGGAFTFVRSTGSANITQIIINEEGTVNANSNLSNLDIYYETAGTCTYDGNETLFGTATSFNSSDQATITGTMAVGTSQICVYAVLDVGSGASASETIEIEISVPGSDITVSSGVVAGASAVQISGTSTITKPYVTVGTTGTQTANVNYDSSNNYIGGAFTVVRGSGSTNITQIIINEEGTVNANSNLSNLDIYYETAGTCTYDGNETLFGTATSFNSSDQATITGTMAVGTSQICVYAVLDVGSGVSDNETIELEISNPSADVTVSSGTVDGTSAIQISGTTTIVKPTITVGTTGTQTANLYNSTNNNYIGGAFTFVRSTGSANITQIIINEEGTVNANSNLSNLDIYYETAGTCTYDGNETLFGTATSFNASDQATITGTMAVGTSQICVYAVLDVGSAYGGSSVELEISNPSTDVTVSSGIVDGTSAVQISGTSTIVKVISVTIEDGSVEYGILDSGNTKDTISTQTQTVTNNGNIAEDFDIKGYDATGGGCTWSLVSGTPSTDQYKHEFSIDSGSHWSYLETSYKSLTTGINNGNNFNLDLKVTMPSSSSCYNQQGTNIFVLATEAELESYTKRKSVTINSSAALTDYQVKIDVTYDSDMQTDFDDIRFTDSGGSTQLSYWLESKTDSTSAAFWIKVPSLSSGDNTIYMYYGNGSAISDSNGANTFELFDHFEGSSLNTNIWNRTGQAGGDTGYSDSISNSILTMTTTNGSSLWWGVASIQTWSSLTTEALVLFSHDNTTTGGEAWGLQGAGQAIFSKGGSKLYESYNSSWQAETTARADLLTTYQRVRITKNGTTSIKFYYNGTLKDTDVTRIPGDVSVLAGKVAKLVSVSGEVKVDWVAARKYADTEPTVSSWGSEESL